jgi:hypothetical protein
VYSVDSTISIVNKIPVGFKLDPKWVEILEIYLNCDNNSVMMSGAGAYFAKHIICPEGTTTDDARYMTSGIDRIWIVSSKHFKNIWPEIRVMCFNIDANDLASKMENIGIKSVDAYCAF